MGTRRSGRTDIYLTASVILAPLMIVHRWSRRTREGVPVNDDNERQSRDEDEDDTEVRTIENRDVDVADGQPVCTPS